MIFCYPNSATFLIFVVRMLAGFLNYSLLSKFSVIAVDLTGASRYEKEEEKGAEEEGRGSSIKHWRPEMEDLRWRV